MAALTVAKLLLSAVFLCYLLQQAQGSAIPTVGFVSVSSSEPETSGLVTISLERTVETNISTTVTIDLSGNATENSDYTVAGSLDVTFPAYDTTNKNVKLFIINDQEVEAGGIETIVLTIRDDAAFTTKVGSGSHTVSIEDDEVSIICKNTQVIESAEKANVKITRSGSSQALIAVHSVGCSTKDDTAVEPSDYTTKNTDLLFKSGSNEHILGITIKDDGVPEGNETLKVRCYTNDVRVHIHSSCKDAVVTIQNDDIYTFFCPGGYATHVREDIGTYSVDICRNGILSSSPSIQLCTLSEEGISPSVSTNCSDVAFPAHSNRTTGIFTINDDEVGEKELQKFQIYLKISDKKVTSTDTVEYNVTIQDNDNTFYLTNITKLQVTEGVGSADVDVTIDREGEISVAANVSLELKFNANAESADCIGTSPRVIQLNANETSRTITACTVVDDRLVEDDETFNVTISGVGTSNVRAGESERIIELISNDVNVTCHGEESHIEQNGLATVRLDRTGATAITANDILCSTADGTASSPTDYLPQASATVSFAINNLTKTFAVVLKGDNVAEANESFTITCNTSDPRVVVDPSCIGIQINIINNDTFVYFCPGYPTSMEVQVGSYTVRVCRVGVLEETHTVRLCRSSDSVSLSNNQPAVQTRCDYTVFTAYDKVKELVIPVNKDALIQKEYATFNISMNTTDPRVTFNDTTSYVVTIHDDYSTFYLTDVTELQKTEGVGSADVNLTINRFGKTSVASNVSLRLVFTASAESADCTGPSTRVIQFDAGVTSRTITVCTVVDDRLVEDDETFNVTISAVSPHIVRNGTSERIIRLISDDVNVACQAVAPLKEADGPAIVTLDRTGATAFTSNDILCSTANGTALSQADYITPNSRRVRFSNNVLTKNFRVVLRNDRVVEGNKSFTVACATSDPRVVVDPSCSGIQINIINDDTYVYFCPGYSTSIEENFGSYTVRLCRVGVLEETHTVGLCRTSDSVSLPHDYPSVQARCDDIVFTAYDTVKELVIPVTNDTWGEQEYKTFNISMNTTDAGVTFNDTTSYVVTIRDDDNTFYLTDVTEMQMTEGVGSPYVTLTINRVGRNSVASNASLQLIFTASAESADCTGPSTRIIQFDAGVTSRTITVCTVVDDKLVEDDETFNVTISGVGSSNKRTGKSERIIKLISNDVNVACEGVSLKETDGHATVILYRTGATTITANNISCSIANGSAFTPIDYHSQTSETVVYFPLHESTKNLSVVIKNDKVVEGNESLAVTCSTSDPRVVVDPSCSGVQINIINDDTYVYFCPGYSTSIEENFGSYTVRLCRVGVLEETHTIRLCRSSDAVSSLHDYPAIRAQCDDIVFTAYDTVKELVIPVTNDRWGEQEYKTFNISMSTTDPRVTFNATTSYVVTIHDDDNTFCFTRTSATVYEEHDRFVNLTIRRRGEIIMSSASVIINTSPQTAITPEDYTEPILNQSLTFFNGEIEKNISINIVNDKLVEDDQTFQLSLTGVDGSTVFPDCNTSTVTIVSNDVNIFCRDRRGPQSVYENKGPVLMEFTREGSLQYNHTMRIRTIDGTAQSGKDYTAINKTLTFAPNQTSINETVLLVNDNVVEPDETFRLSVTSSDDRVNMICNGTQFTLLNDDTFVRCTDQSIDVSEGNKTVYFTLKREGVLNKSSPIWFSTKDGTAFDKSDYKPQNKVNKTFLPGQVYMTLSVGLVNDEYKEDNENFSVRIGSHIPTTLTSGDKCALITIEDDEPNPEDRMTKQQAQALLVKERNVEILLGVAVAIMAVVVLLFIFFFCYVLRLGKKG